MPPDIFDLEFNPNKYLVHWDRLNALSRGKDVPPVTLELDVSSACDHRCQWCVDPPGVHTGKFMSISTAKRILDEAKALGVKGIVFKGGGESTLHPNFAEILRLTDAFGFEVGLVTHGGHLTPQIVEAAADCCEYVRISIDGPTSASRKDVHGVDDFDSVVEGARNLVATKGSRRHPVVGLTFCLDYRRRHLIGKCLELGDTIKPDYILIRPPFCEEVGYPSPNTPDEAAELRSKIMGEVEGYSGEVSVMIGNWIGDKELDSRTSIQKRDASRRDAQVCELKYNSIEHVTRRCFASALTLVITAGGDVYGCCCLRGIKEFSFGQIEYEMDKNLSMIMSSQKRRKVIDRMKRTSCLEHCTHPLSRPNEIIEYLSRPKKHHSSFI